MFVSATGICHVSPNGTYGCQCQPNWSGERCESKVDYCASSPCLNGGVCRSLVGGYQCECLTDSYSGRHCEKAANGVNIREILVKSFVSVAILVICTVAMFIAVMDVLNYVFGINPAKKFLKEQSLKKPKSRQKKFIFIARFKYTPGSWND